MVPCDKILMLGSFLRHFHVAKHSLSREPIKRREYIGGERGGGEIGEIGGLEKIRLDFFPPGVYDSSSTDTCEDNGPLAKSIVPGNTRPS